MTAGMLADSRRVRSMLVEQSLSRSYTVEAASACALGVRPVLVVLSQLG